MVEGDLVEAADAVGEQQGRVGRVALVGRGVRGGRQVRGQQVGVGAGEVGAQHTVAEQGCGRQELGAGGQSGDGVAGLRHERGVAAGAGRVPPVDLDVVEEQHVQVAVGGRGFVQAGDDRGHGVGREAVLALQEVQIQARGPVQGGAAGGGRGGALGQGEGYEARVAGGVRGRQLTGGFVGGGDEHLETGVRLRGDAVQTLVQMALNVRAGHDHAEVGHGAGRPYPVSSRRSGGGTVSSGRSGSVTVCSFM